MPHTTLEICIDSVAGAIAAQRGGADRLELCSALSEGGLTPSAGLVDRVQATTALPTMVMIRPRGGDYRYAESELQTMLEDIRIIRDAGVYGVVFGALDSSGAIDEATCQALLEAAQPLQTTYHRAFDVCADPAAALEQLIELGFKRVLTSGQCATAAEGVGAIRGLVEQAGDRIVVMPGCGVRPENAQRIIRQTGASEIHGTASSWHACGAAEPSELDQASRRRATSEDVVRSVRAVLDRSAG